MLGDLLESASEVVEPRDGESEGTAVDSGVVELGDGGVESGVEAMGMGAGSPPSMQVQALRPGNYMTTTIMNNLKCIYCSGWI